MHAPLSGSRPLLALLLFLGGCAPQFPVPSGARIACSDQGTCPTPLVCQTKVKLCVNPADADSTPPGAEQITFSEKVLRAGKTAIVSFRATEALLAEPTAELQTEPARPLTLLDAKEGVYRFGYTAASTEREAESIPVYATLVDSGGNEARVLLGDLRFDFTPPSVGAVLIAPLAPLQTAAKPGDRLQLSAQVGLDAATVVLQVRSGTNPATDVTFERTAEGLLTAAFDVPADAQGTLVATVSAGDAVGNLRSAESAPLVIDVQAPQAGALVLNTAIPVVQGTQTTLSVTGAADIVALRLDGDLQDGPNVRTWLRFSRAAEYLVFLTPSPGAKTVTARFADAAGNTSEASSNTVTLEADTVAPTIVSFTADTGGQEWVNQLTVPVSFFATDNTGTVAAYLLSDTKTSALPAELTLPVPATMPVPFTFQPGDGVKTLRLWTKDARDNINNPPASLTVKIDRTLPQVTAFTRTSPAATSSRKVDLSLTATDAGGSGISRWLVRPAAGTPTPAEFPAGAAAPTSLDLPDADGPYTLHAWVLDAAGNVCATDPTQPVTLDRVAPAVTLSAASYHPAGPTLALSLTDTDATPSSGVTGYGVFDQPAHTPPPTVQAADLGTPTRPTSLNVVAGVRSVFAYARDAAGNVSAPARRSYVAGTASPTLSTVITNQDGPAIARNEAGDMVVAWAPTSSSIVARYFPRDGGPPSGEIDVTHGLGDERMPAVSVAPDGSFAVAWRDSPGGSPRVRARVFAPDGSVKRDTFFCAETFDGFLGTDLDFPPRIALGSDRVVCAFTSNQAMRARAYRLSDGTQIGSGLESGGGGALVKVRPSLALSPSGVAVACWQQEAGSDFNVHCGRLAADGSTYAAGIYFTGNAETAPLVDIYNDGAERFALLHRNSSVPELRLERFDLASFTSLGTFVSIPETGKANLDLKVRPDGTVVLTWDSAGSVSSATVGATLGATQTVVSGEGSTRASLAATSNASVAAFLQSAPPYVFLRFF